MSCLSQFARRAFDKAACRNADALYDFDKVLSKKRQSKTLTNWCFVQSMFDDSFTISSEIFDDLHYRLISCINNIDMLEQS